MKKISLILISTVLLFGGACKQQYEGATISAEEQAEGTPVRIELLESTTDPIPIEAGGVLSTKKEMNLSFKIGGFIDRLYADEGQRVGDGQLLAQLNPTEINAQVIKARQQVQKLERDLQRVKKLYADTAATLEQVQDLSTALEVAEADLQIAEYNQQYSKIYAPAGGRLLRRFAETNELVQPGQPIFQLAGDGKNAFILNIGVADRDVVRLRLGDRADIRFDAYPGENFTAYVSEIAEAANPATGAFDLELAVNPAGKKLRNGFVGKVTLYPGRQAPYFRVPMDALVEGYRDQAKVFLADSGRTKALSRSVRPEYIGADFFTISTTDLPADAYVITAGAAYLKDGAKIRIIEDRSNRENQELTGR